MEWDTDSPNPEYVSELLELYEHTDAYKAGVSPFDIFLNTKNVQLEFYQTIRPVQTCI